MNPADYDAWYYTPRGNWVGDTEFALLQRLLRAEPGESLLDVGCGTGYFTRRFAGETELNSIGIDPNLAWVKYAAAHALEKESYQTGQAEHLPFVDDCFDCTVSVTALCFIQDQQQAIREIVRVTRKRFAIGLLNRRSLLYFQKGRKGGRDAYQGAHWHTADEIRALFAGLPVSNLAIHCAIFLPGGGRASRVLESMFPDWLALGGFIAVAGDIGSPQ